MYYPYNQYQYSAPTTPEAPTKTKKAVSNRTIKPAERKNYDPVSVDDNLAGNIDFARDMRNVTLDEIMKISVMNPNKDQFAYEFGTLDIDAVDGINEIRKMNIIIAEACAELERRKTLALLEYMTQVNVRLITMCHVED